MTKISIVSGFLGAGKTTLIQKLLKEVFQNEKIAIIENEFGDVGIDGGFLKNTGIQVTEMNSGCICCSLVGDFGKNMREVIAEYEPDHIIVEPSGVGKLSDVVKSVQELALDMEVELSALITVVNGKKCLKQMKAFGEFFNNQLEHASTIILSRSQEMTEEQLIHALGAISQKNSKAAIITTPWEKLTGKQILSAVDEKSAFIESAIEEIHHHEECACGCGHDDHHKHDHHDHHADEVFVSWGIETPHQFSKAQIINALETLTNDSKYEHTILRAKGMVQLEDASWLYFDMVPGDFEVRVGEPEYIGKIVVIGTKVDEEVMENLFGLE